MKDWKKDYEKVQREMLGQGDFNFDKLTPEQRDLILEPSEAPENFYCDGEIDGETAVRIWIKRLYQAKLNLDQVTKAFKLNFG